MERLSDHPAVLNEKQEGETSIEPQNFTFIQTHVK
jgi:hypothetical protein